MPYLLKEEYCGRWWHYWLAGPNLYIHLVDIPGLPESYCEVAQPVNLLRLPRYSIPVACVPLTYRVGEDRWVVAGTRANHFYRRPDRLAKALAKAVETWPYGCRWSPVGPVPPGVYDTELLEEALRRMPILRPRPEELAVDYVVWSFSHPADFLHSPYVYLSRAKHAEEKWAEICPHEDPRACYQGALGELLASFKAQGKVPAVDSILFGKRFARPWGQKETAVHTEKGKVYVYYVLGHLLKAILPRMQVLKEQSEWEFPRLDLTPLDVQGPLLRKARRRRPEPLAPIESDFFPTSSSQVERGGPLAAFDLLDL